MSNLIDGLTPEQYLKKHSEPVEFDKCQETEYVNERGETRKLLLITVSSDTAAMKAFVTFVNHVGEFDYFAMLRGEQVKVWRPDGDDDAGITLDCEMTRDEFSKFFNLEELA